MLFLTVDLDLSNICSFVFRDCFFVGVLSFLVWTFGFVLLLNYAVVLLFSPSRSLSRIQALKWKSWKRVMDDIRKRIQVKRQN